VLKQFAPVLFSAAVALTAVVGLRPSVAQQYPPTQPHLAERDGYQNAGYRNTGYQYAGRPADPQPLPPVAALERCEGTLILARVASEAILAGDILASVDELLTRSEKKLKPEELEAQRKQIREQLARGLDELAARLRDGRPATQAELQRRALIQQFLRQQIDTKLICHDARQTIPEENFPMIEKSLGKMFDEMALEKLMERYRAETRADLDRVLRAAGTSLAQEKQRFIDRALAQQWVREQVKTDDEITYDQMRQYYYEHPTEFDVPAGSTWEQLSVRFSTHPSKDEAYATIAWMGNQVRHGVAFAEVAKAHSDGPTAAAGGIRQWPTKDLVSDELKVAIAGLPEGQMSQIIQDWRGYHIIRVVERHEARHMAFDEARTQEQIREKIRQNRLKEQWQEYVKRLAERTPVWTIFDDLPETRQARAK